MTSPAVLMLVGAGEADRHLERCLRSARGWADVLLVYGDAPDDATRRLIRRHAHISRIGDEPVFAESEAAARNQLFELADEHLRPGDVVCVLDADEEIAQGPLTVRCALDALDGDSGCVHFLHLWDSDGTMHRVDGLWQPSIGPRIYRHQPGLRVQPLPGAWVCPPLPRHLMRFGPPVLDVLHWGYARPQDRPWKHERYSRLPGHASAHVDSILTEPTLEPVP